MLSQAADVAWGRKATAGDSWLHPPGPGGQGSTGLLPSAGLAQAPLSPHNLRLPLLEAGPEMEKLDLSSAGQWRLPCSQGTQRLAEPWSQALGTSSVHCRPPHPSNHLKTRPGGTWGWSWGGLGKEGGSAHQSALPSTPRSSSSLAPSSQAQSSFPFNIRDAVCPAWGFTWSLIGTDPVQHMHKHTHTLSLTS